MKGYGKELNGGNMNKEQIIDEAIGINYCKLNKNNK